jgi:subtilisin family serine protease
VSDADIDAPEAWDITRGNGTTVVGVIDSGVDYTHPDLASNIWINSGEVAGDNVDNDGNGYVDDVRGWDFANNDNNAMDDNGHGTHVSGTIAATQNNGVGVAGVASAKIMPLKFLGADGNGSTSAAIAAINYATKMRRDYKVDLRVLNNSWGGGGFSQALYDAVKASGDQGILFAAAAGNGGADQVGDDNDLYAQYPANYNLANIISIAATDTNDVRGSFSNYGATSVDLAAPGVDVLSTYPGGQYAYMSGTSMATPHVSGAAALAFSASPTATVAQVKAAILNGVDLVAAMSGKSVTGGRLNAQRMLQTLTAPAPAPAPAPTVPAAPTSLAASALSGTQIRLTWTDKASNETGYKIERSTNGSSGWTQIATVGANVTSYTAAGLKKRTAYYFRVRAYNTSGNSAYSNVASTRTTNSGTVAAAGLTAAGSPFSTTPLDRSDLLSVLA